MFSIPCIFLENLAKSYVGTPWTVSASPVGNLGSAHVSRSKAWEPKGIFFFEFQRGFLTKLWNFNTRQQFYQKECIPVGCLPPACWPCLGEGVLANLHRCKHPCIQTPHRGGPLLDADPPGCRTPLEVDPLDADLIGQMTCDACWEANPPWMLVMFLPCEQNDWETGVKHYLAPNFICVR